MSFQMLPMIRKPTRIIDYISTLIDNVFCSFIVCSHISDHLTVLITFELHSVKSTNYKSVSFSMINEHNLSRFNGILMHADWSSVKYFCQANSADLSYQEFSIKFAAMCIDCFPFKRSSANKKNIPKQPLITKAVIMSFNKISRLYKKFLKHPTEKNRLSFVKYRNKLQSLSHTAEKHITVKNLLSVD